MSTDLLAFSATAALPAGAAAAGALGRALRTVRWGRVGLAVLGALSVTAVAGEVLGAPGDARTSEVGAWAAIVGLAMVGAAVAGFDLPRALGRALPLLVLAALLDGAPMGWGLFYETPPFGVEATARLLDASPRTLVLETAGVDWMRDPAVYGPAGADRIGPGSRVPYAVGVAGQRVLLVGCLLLAARVVLSTARRWPLDPWLPDASTAPSPPR